QGYLPGRESKRPPEPDGLVHGGTQRIHSIRPKGPDSLPKNQAPNTVPETTGKANRSNWRPNAIPFVRTRKYQPVPANRQQIAYPDGAGCTYTCRHICAHQG